MTRLINRVWSWLWTNVLDPNPQTKVEYGAIQDRYFVYRRWYAHGIWRIAPVPAVFVSKEEAIERAQALRGSMLRVGQDAYKNRIIWHSSGKHRW